MPPLNLDGNRLAVFVYGLLRRADGGRRLHGGPKQNVAAVRDAAEHAARVVRLFFDAALTRAEDIVIFAAAPGAHPEAVAELDALHRADTHDRLCELCVELIENGLTESREHPRDAAAHRAAERIPVPHHFF